MGDFTQRIQNALNYIEDNLTGELDVCKIAQKAYVSAFYFQRIFTAHCGISVGEYIRNRRLTMAAQELASTHTRIIDIAAKYGYDSPDSFNRAFQRFHGVSPSAARKAGTSLRSYAPVTIRPALEGGSMMEYRIVEKPQFTVVGVSRKFHTDTSYQEIPEFWDEFLDAAVQPVIGMYGICMDLDEKGEAFDYVIAENYIPWKEIPEGCVVKVIPASSWAVFPCRGPLDKTLQDLNTRMWTQWLPSCKSHRLAGNYNIELYSPPQENPEDDYMEIWLPVEKNRLHEGDTL